MKTTIKIHDTKWFKEHCRVVGATDSLSELEPKYDSWKGRSTVSWLTGNLMGLLEGKVLQVEHDAGIGSGIMDNARYSFGGYWIPNWAIEWVKEEEYDDTSD